MIPQRNLSLLANRLYKEHGGRRIPEAVLERDYCLAWFLVGLSQCKLRDLLIFKLPRNTFRMPSGRHRAETLPLRGLSFLRRPGLHACKESGVRGDPRRSGRGV
jgi:hypothetical protein